MPATVCPHCGVEIDLGAADVSQIVECPACEQQFPAATEPPAHSESPADDEPAEVLIRYARQQCEGTVVGLLVIGTITVMIGLCVVIEFFYQFGNISGRDIWPSVYGLYMLCTGGFWVYAGLQMKEAKQYGVCLMACATLLPALNPCCILGPIFGAMGLGRLNDPRVRRGFAANRPNYDQDVAA